MKKKELEKLVEADMKEDLKDTEYQKYLDKRQKNITNKKENKEEHQKL